MSVYSSRLSAAISRASSSSSTKRMRFLSLLEFIIPFVRSVFFDVFFCEATCGYSFPSLFRSQRNQREKCEMPRRCYSGVGTHRFQRAGVDRSTLGGPAAPGADSYSCAIDSNQCAFRRDCTLEAMRTQACANQCMDFKGLLFAQSSVI